jgi:hypothetical protein
VDSKGLAFFIAFLHFACFDEAVIVLPLHDIGKWLADRRFWICKIIIVLMDAAILRGALSMGAEYCTQDDEISSFGWVLWSSFLVFCKFVYLRPVYHLHTLGVFHSSVADARKSAFLEFLCFASHISMFASLAYRAIEPGFTVYVSGTCTSRNKGWVNHADACAKAGKVYCALHHHGFVEHQMCVMLTCV